MNTIMENQYILKSTKQQENKFLNFLKGFGCICVVFIHFPFPGVFGLIVKRLSFFAVPIFFMISGYFVYNNDESICKKIIRKRIKKICKIILLSCGFYFLYTLLYNIIKNDAAEFLIKVLSAKTFVDFVIVNNFEIIDAYHLWFLPSLLYSYCVLLFLNKRCLSIMAYKLLPFLFVIKFITELIVETFGFSYHWRCNVIIGALPYVLLGNCIAYKEKKIGNLNSKNHILCIFFSVTATIGLTVFDVFIGFWWICISVFSISLFLIAVRNPNVIIIKVVRKIGIEYSLYVYVFHVIVYRVISNIYLIIGWNQCIIIQWMTPIIVVFTSIIWAKIIKCFVRKKTFIKLMRVETKSRKSDHI